MGRLTQLSSTVLRVQVHLSALACPEETRAALAIDRGEDGGVT
jgi:hypothetical protein